MISHTEVVFERGRRSLVTADNWKRQNRKFELAPTLTGAGQEGVTPPFILLTYPANEVSNYTCTCHLHLTGSCHLVHDEKPRCSEH